MPARDPVCGMTVDPARAAASADFGGTLYYFCCAKCAEKFRSDPEKYLTAKVPEAVHGSAVSTQFAQLGGIKPASSGMVATIVPAAESGASVAEGSATSAPAHALETEPHPRRTAKPAPPHAQAAAYIVPWIPKFARTVRPVSQVRNGVEARSCRRPRRRAPNIPARCIRKSCAPSPARAPSAAWLWSRAPRWSRKKIPNSFP